MAPKGGKKPSAKKSKASAKSSKSVSALASKKSKSSIKLPKGDSKKSQPSETKVAGSESESKKPLDSKSNVVSKAGSKSKAPTKKGKGSRKSPKSLKEALRKKRDPMGGAAGIHGHGKKHAGKHGDPSHPHHGSHHKKPPVVPADANKPPKRKHHHHKHRKAHTFEGYESLATEEVYEVSTLAKRYVRGFLPLRVLLSIAGRFPLTVTRNDNDGTYNYNCAWYLPHGWYFLLTTFLIFLLICIVVLNVVLFKARFQLFHYLGHKWNLPKLKLSWGNAPYKVVQKKPINPETQTRLQIELHEDIVFDRHLIILIVFMCNLVNALIGSFNIIRKRRYLVRYFTVWTKATEKLYMDIGFGMFTFSMIHTLIFLAFITCMALLYTFNVGSTPRGGSTLIAMTLFRPFRPELFEFKVGKLWSDNTDKTYRKSTMDPFLPYFQIAGGTTLLISFLWSKSLLLIFIFKCQLLINSFGIFNGRVYATVLRGREYNQTEDGRAAYKILFKDHCVLLDLLEGTDRFFSLILETFFGLHITSLMAEMYFTLLFLRTAWDSKHERKLAEVNHYFVRRDAEFVSGFVICLLNILYLVQVSKSASDVGGEACAGLEVVRRKTMLGRKTDEELYFNFSMYFSYIAYKGCILRAGGYFDLNKDFMVGLFSVFLSYFIIVEQFHPYFDRRDNPSLKAYDTRGRIGIFLYKLEDLRDCHWVFNESIIKDPHDCNIFPKSWG